MLDVYRFGLLPVWTKLDLILQQLVKYEVRERSSGNVDQLREDMSLAGEIYLHKGVPKLRVVPAQDAESI